MNSGLIRCDGHRFKGVVENPYGIVNVYKCIDCGLKVGSKYASEYLEGKKS